MMLLLVGWVIWNNKPQTINHTFQTIISGEMLRTSTQCHTFAMYDNTGQKTRLYKFHYVWKQSSLQKLGPLKILTGSCTDLNADSGSCSGSNLKYWLRLLLQPKTQTPAAVHTGTTAPWSSLSVIQCQAKFLTCEISDFMPCAHAQSNILHIK